MPALLLALALGQAAPAAVTPAAPRAIDFTRLPDGSFRATLDGQPVAGADFYRAVLRPDLAARSEEARSDRTALQVAAVAAPLFGVGMGWVAGTAHQWPLPPCVGEPPFPVSCTARDQVASQNRAAMNRALVAGSVAGVASGALFLFLGSRVRQVEPTADEAEALVRAYRARTAPAAVPAGPAGGASLRLEAGPGVVGLALLLGF